MFVWLCSRAAFAYGPAGHEIVGGIADKLLANTAAGRRVASMIDGMKLGKAALVADEIKAWDIAGADDPSAFPQYSAHPEIDKQLRDFWRANQPTHNRGSQMPSHHWFHYTDVPVLNPHKYADGKTGRNRWDIVHMIRYCVGVLHSEIPEDNARKITKPVAVILLAHYVADIHQPLHVGAMYFDESGRAVDPDRGDKGIEDDGGNTIMLRLNHGTIEELTKRGLKLHGFWDNEAVLANLQPLPITMSTEERGQAMERAKHRLMNQLTREQPPSWRLPANVPLKNCAEDWADEILPVAREAHERLKFVNVHPQREQDRTVSAGTALEKAAPDGMSYTDWAAKIVRSEMHKAGWRLADLLSQVLTSAPLDTGAE